MSRNWFAAFLVALFTVVYTADAQITAYLSGSLSSGTYVLGEQNVPFDRWLLRIDEPVRIAGIRTQAVNASSADVFGVALWDLVHETRISDIMSLSDKPPYGTTEFESLNYVMTPKTGTIELRASVSANASPREGVFFVLQEITAFREDGTPATVSGLPLNDRGVVRFNIRTSGTLSVQRSASDSPLATIHPGFPTPLFVGEAIAVDENLTVEKIEVLVNDSPDPTVFTPNAVDEVPVIQFRDYDTGDLYGEAAVMASGDTPGLAIFYVAWAVPENSIRSFMISGVGNTIVNGADLEAQVYVHILRVESHGQTQQVNWTTPVSGNPRIFRLPLGGDPPPPPPLPPQVWEETFNLAAGEWNFFFPVGIPDSPFEMPVYSWDATRQGYVQEYFGGGAVVSVAVNTTVRVSTHERPTEELTLSPGWNLVGFTRFLNYADLQRFPFLSNGIGLWELISLQEGVVQAAVWSQTEDRYLRVGVRADGVYWYDGDTSSSEFLVRPGSAFFVHYIGEELTLFDPNKAFLFLKGAPSLTPSTGMEGDEGAIAPPPFPTGISPRGKSLKTWGALKRQ